MAKIEEIRTSHNGNKIYRIPLGNVEGTQRKYKSGKKGYFVFSKVFLNGKVYQLSGNLIEIA